MAERAVGHGSFGVVFQVGLVIYWSTKFLIKFIIRLENSNYRPLLVVMEA